MPDHLLIRRPITGPRHELDPELAETFFNSVTTKILHHSYFRNDFIFVRPALSTEYIENDEPAATPTYRAYYPTRETLRETCMRVVTRDC